MDTREQRDEFLARRSRFAMLTTLRRDGSPITVPVWYGWDGELVSMFSAAGGPKLSRIENDPRVTVLVANDRDETEYWVAFDGNAEIHRHGGLDLAERLAGHYWDLEDRERADILTSWRAAGDAGFRLITMAPTSIRTY